MVAVIGVPLVLLAGVLWTLRYWARERRKVWGDVAGSLGSPSDRPWRRRCWRGRTTSPGPRAAGSTIRSHRPSRSSSPPSGRRAGRCCSSACAVRDPVRLRLVAIEWSQ